MEKLIEKQEPQFVPVYQNPRYWPKTERTEIRVETRQSLCGTRIIAFDNDERLF